MKRRNNFMDRESHIENNNQRRSSRNSKKGFEKPIDGRISSKGLKSIAVAESEMISRGFKRADRRRHDHAEQMERNGKTMRWQQKGGGEKDKEKRNVYSRKKELEYRKSTINMGEPMRLNRFIAYSGICSRRDADSYIKAGVVKVNGEVVTELGTKIVPARDRILFHDQLLRAESLVYVLLNKPKDCVTTVEDPHAKLTVMDIVKGVCNERIYPVGRLDRNTTGVLLLTNDGELASVLTHPKFNKKKVYQVSLDKPITKENMQRLLDGVRLEDGVVKADEIELVDGKDMCEVGIEIHSGKNRVVRRMFEAIGYKVKQLDRVMFAGLTKKNLPRGRWRYLSDKEVGILKMGAYE